MRKFRKEECVIDFDVFGYEVHVIFTTDLQKSRDTYDTIIGRKFDVGDAIAFHNATNNKSYLFFPWEANPEQITHESWHAVRYMFEEWIGAALENETVAYHLGHLVGAIHGFQTHIRKEKHGKKGVYRVLYGSFSRCLCRK